MKQVIAYYLFRFNYRNRGFANRNNGIYQYWLIQSKRRINETKRKGSFYGVKTILLLITGSFGYRPVDISRTVMNFCLLRLFCLKLSHSVNAGASIYPY